MLATFRPADDRTRKVLRQGRPFSSVARFSDTDITPVSLTMEAYQQGDDLVRIELLVHPEQTKQLPEGIGFELVAGNVLLGSGRILRPARERKGV